jgi:type I restriction enzyme, R subunit
MLNFEFLQEGWTEWIHIYKSAMSAIIYSESDPLVACMYARRALEIAVKWMYRNDSKLSSTSWSKDSTLHELITFERLHSFVEPMILVKCQAITRLGNRAIHELEPIEPVEVETIIIYLYEVCLWLFSYYPTSPYKGNKFSKEYIAKLLSELQISGSVKIKELKIKQQIL